ncbi:MAG: molybdopterin-dependent oxidoreductase [Ilumatobacter sp.]|uniref:molybdopterin-dependent oxidoreductase n=1 Tax=Ilumatobacter sp. TaxID=1967498 RepID=UPI0039191984
MATRGFQGRARSTDGRVPPGQYVTDDFPVLTAGPTEFVDTSDWELTVSDGIVSTTFDWAALHELPMETITTDIHCVTHWSKFDTTWRGVPIESLFEAAGVGDFDFALVSSYGGYTTNLPVTDLLDRDAMVAVEFDGAPLEAEHGGPARLLVPHLYLWKSAKWLSEIRLGDDEDQGFWEAAGYHNYGDPWSEQRYTSD